MATKFITISTEIMHDKNLSANQKFILAEIEQLTQLDKGCVASNQHFSELIGIAKESVSRCISDLERKGYIDCEIEKGTRNHIRNISLNKTSSLNKVLRPPKQSVKTPLTKHQESKENKTINKTINKEKIYKKEFSFSLSKTTQYQNLSEDYKKKLKAKCLLIDGNYERYEDFIMQLEAKGYKYKDFSKAYIAWDKEKTYKSFSPTPEPMLGDDWFKVPISHSEVIAINSKTLETKIGQVETSINNDESVNEVPISAKTQDFLSVKGLI